MTDLVEGDLRFSFPGTASAYDQWGYYRNQFINHCSQNKAVDAVFVHEGVTWLVEVKDYSQNNREKPSDLADEVAVKVRDTLAGLVGAASKSNSDHERTQARAAVRAPQVRVVLHLEVPKHPSRLLARVPDPALILQKLRQCLRAVDSHPIVMSRAKPHATVPWTVERV